MRSSSIAVAAFVLGSFHFLACGSSDETVTNGDGKRQGSSGTKQGGGAGAGVGGATSGGGATGSVGGATSGGGATSDGGSTGTSGASGASGGAEVCGNGLDDDADGLVDQGCACASGATQACYLGPVGTAGKGKCKQGVQTCQGTAEFLAWSVCEGAIVPEAENCDDGIDDDCDGVPDNGCVTCTPVTELCGNGIDDDCDGSIDEDCAACTATGKEVCGNKKDDDCNGLVDDGCSACVPAGGVEVCGNQKDDDCNGSIDDGCTGGCVKAPGGVEVCGNKVDDDCNGSVDETCQCQPGETMPCPGKGACAGNKKECVNGLWSECKGGGKSAPEVCGNKIDDDCNGVVDNGCTVCFGVGTSPWEYVRDKSVKCFGKELDDSDPKIFDFASIPGGGWTPWGKPLIDFDATSDLPDGDKWCDEGGHHGGTFTYFRTNVTAADASALKSVVATWGGADDAVMVRVVDGAGKLRANPNWNKSPVNLTGQLTAGKNVIYAIHVDTNPTTRLLGTFKITVNGGVLTQCK